MFDLLLTPFSYPLDPTKRLFWGFLLSSLAMACVAAFFGGNRKEVKGQIVSLFRWRYWVNQSVGTDVGLLFLNNAIRLIVLVPMVGVKLAGAIAVTAFFQVTFGDVPAIHVHWLLVGLAYSICFFVVEDVTRFYLHYYSHIKPWLWRFHKVHHSATVLNPLTIHRVHPVEMALYFFRGFIVFSVVAGVFLYLFRGQVHGLDILGVEMFGFLFNVLGSNLRHTPVWISFGKIERIFISPAQHQIHHSCDIKHHDKNMGTCLALWDRLMGSWVASKDETVTRFGLTRP